MGMMNCPFILFSHKKTSCSSWHTTWHTTEHPEACQVVCQEVCQEVCPVVCQEEQEVPQVPVVQEDQPSKKSIKYQINLYHVVYLSNRTYSNSHSTNYLIAC